MPHQVRKTRIVCISDTHNTTFKLPAGDVLIHAGDLTKQGSLSELRRTIEWIDKADFEAKIIVAGNHDVTLDRPFYEQYGASFHSGQNAQDLSACMEVVRQSRSITYLQHSSAIIRLTSPSGPQTEFKVFGSPYSPARSTGSSSSVWAFQYGPEAASELWSQIPLDADVVVTHTPPKYHCDEKPRGRGSGGSGGRGGGGGDGDCSVGGRGGEGGEPRGCPALRESLWRVRPRLLVCGHVHEARGGEIVAWDLVAGNARFKERAVRPWIDASAGSKKLAKLDLTRGGGERFEYWDGADERGVEDGGGGGGDDNAGSWVEEGEDQGQGEKGGRGEEEDQHTDSSPTSSSIFSRSRPARTGERSPQGLPTTSRPVRATQGRPSAHASPSRVAVGESEGINRTERDEQVARPGSGTIGQALPLSPSRSDLEALSGRMGRRETCIINAAIMATSWPYRGAGAERYNKPIVVDVDLPAFGSRYGQSSLT